MLKIDRDGIIFAGIACFGAILAMFISSFLSLFLFCFSIFTLYFFRDPERFAIYDNESLISPADGRILYVKDIKFSDLKPEISENFFASDGSEIDSNALYTKVSIFMNVFNVHINRSPFYGVIEKVNYIRGRFFNASLDKASEFNERCIYKLQPMCEPLPEDDQSKVKHNYGGIVFVQIAGLIARRIRSDIFEGNVVNQGQRIGLIRYGSRVDVYFSKAEYEVLVIENQTTIAGETLIAKRNNVN